MSLKQEIETWVEAVGHYDNNEYEEALRTFDAIADTSKILFNCGVIHATLGQHSQAVQCYQKAVRLDQYFALAYFQQGVSNFLFGDFEEALANFNDTLLYLRGNTFIDYEQRGLKFKLYSCEVLFNRGLCYVYLQQKEAGLQDFQYAVKEKQVEDHDVIDEAIKEEAEGYTVFSIPVGLIYRPNSAKVKNLKTKDYLGKATLVAASDRNNAFTGFAGTERRQNLLPGETAKDERPAENISFAASNLVKPELRSRTRQQSEPPINRNVFPPTPPPDADKPVLPANSINDPPERPRSTLNSRALSVRTGGGGSDRFNESPIERPRLGTVRTASEPRGPSRGWRSDSVRARQNTRLRTVDDGGVDEYADDVYDMYSSRGMTSPPKRTSSRQRMASRRYQDDDAQRPAYIEEEDEFGSDYDGSDIDEGDFEMMSSSRPKPRGHARTGSRAPDVRKIRVKVHANEDTRYVMIGPAVEFADFMDRIRDKFTLKSRFRIRFRDEGDMITMADQDDLELAISAARRESRREGSDMGKMEVWVM